MKHAFEVKRLIGLLVCVGAILGMDTSSLSLFLGVDYFKKYFGYPDAIGTGIITGANQIGGFFGCLLSGTIIDVVGCKWSLCICSVVWNLGSVGSVLAFEVYTLSLSRFVKGFAVGIMSVLASFYLMEVFSNNIRGQATALMQMSLTIAILSVFFLSLLLDGIESPLAFKLTWGLETIPSILLLGLFKALPESPRWLHKHGHPDADIARSLSILRGSDVETFKQQFTNDTKPKAKLSYIVRKGFWRHMCLGIMVQILIQTSGINVMMYYMVYICEMLGFDVNTSSKLTAGPYILNVVFTLIPVFMLDRFSRKVFLGWAGLLLGAIMMAIGLLIGERGRHTGDVVIRNIVVSLCFLFVSVFASSLSCAGFVYTNEILPESIKSVALSICISTNWLTGFVLALVTPRLFQLVEWWTFIVLGLSTIALSLVVICLFPETKGLTPFQINNLFNPETGFDLKTEKIDSEGTLEVQSIPDRSGAPEPSSFSCCNSTIIEVAEVF